MNKYPVQYVTLVRSHC